MEVSDLHEKLVQHAADNAAKFYELNSKLEGKSMSEKIEINAAGDQSAMMMAALAGRGGGDGLLGGGSGGGVLGGVLLASLLGRNGGLLGGADGAGAVLRNPPEQTQANMSLMQSIGAVDKAVAVGTAAMEASQAAQSANIISAVTGTVAPISNRIDSVKDAVNANSMVLSQQLNGIDRSIMENRYELSKDITADGVLTRSLITSQYEATLNRQLSEANAALIELRSDARLSERARGIEINTTNNIAQAQTQQQQQAQFGQLYSGLMDAVQSIRATNQAINIGGSQTANPTNTNTNIR
jgi:hypothetical protein